MVTKPSNEIVLVFFTGGAGHSFIFSLVNKDHLPPFKSVLRQRETPIVRYSGHAVIFGCGDYSSARDISISDNANSNSTSFSDFGYSYTLPEGYVAGRNEARFLLAGSFNFTPTELEVFH